ncbi:MAG TPA: SH3 domain-containing protein [Blastocatellia bacterium]|nr:SH3 domain-containing protein [Blastocatellia bacterium]
MSIALISRRYVLATILVFGLGVVLTACSILSGDPKIGEGIVIAPKLKIRSTTAQVALDLAEVKRGDKLEILDHAEIKTPTQIDEWYKVRTKAADGVVGWVQARDMVNQAVVDKTEVLFQKSKELPAQGKGRLKVRTKLRVDPGGDVATFLSRNTQVEIVGKQRTTIKPEKQASEDTDEAAEEPEARTILWYEIRLPEAEILKAGWVGAQQVDLDVPEEIMYLEGEGRRFTGWVVFDQSHDKAGRIKNNYIGLMKSLGTEGPIDFTRLWVLSYSPAEGHYNGSYIEDGLKGVLPVTLETASGHKGFTIHELDDSGKVVPVEYQLLRIDANHVRVSRLEPKIYHKKVRR